MSVTAPYIAYHIHNVLLWLTRVRADRSHTYTTVSWLTQLCNVTLKLQRADSGKRRHQSSDEGFLLRCRFVCLLILNQAHQCDRDMWWCLTILSPLVCCFSQICVEQNKSTTVVFFLNQLKPKKHTAPHLETGWNHDINKNWACWYQTWSVQLLLSC